MPIQIHMKKLRFFLQNRLSLLVLGSDDSLPCRVCYDCRLNPPEVNSDILIRLVRLAGSYRCWFVYVREWYCWLVRCYSSHGRGLASQPSQPQPSERADGNKSHIYYYLLRK